MCIRPLGQKRDHQTFGGALLGLKIAAPYSYCCTMLSRAASAAAHSPDASRQPRVVRFVGTAAAATAARRPYPRALWGPVLARQTAPAQRRRRRPLRGNRRRRSFFPVAFVASTTAVVGGAGIIAVVPATPTAYPNLRNLGLEKEAACGVRRGCIWVEGGRETDSSRG